MLCSRRWRICLEVQSPRLIVCLSFLQHLARVSLVALYLLATTISPLTDKRVLIAPFSKQRGGEKSYLRFNHYVSITLPSFVWAWYLPHLTVRKIRRSFVAADRKESVISGSQYCRNSSAPQSWANLRALLWLLGSDYTDRRRSTPDISLASLRLKVNNKQCRARVRWRRMCVCVEKGWRGKKTWCQQGVWW